MSVVVITPPEPTVDLDMVKQHLRIDGDDEDTLIQVYIDAARAMIDGPVGWLGPCIGQQEFRLELNGFPQPIWGWARDDGGLF